MPILGYHFVKGAYGQWMPGDDLYPTLADMTGHTVPAELEGKSLRPLLADPQADWAKPAISQVFYGEDKKGYTIRTQRYRYIEWNGGKAGEELHDHERDPNEVRNLAAEAEFVAVKQRLKTALQPFVKY